MMFSDRMRELRGTLAAPRPDEFFQSNRGIKGVRVLAPPSPDDMCRPNGGKGGVGTREERRWGGDPCGRPRDLIRPGGTQDTHKGPPIHPSPPVSLRFGASRASSLARPSPFRLAHIIRMLGTQAPPQYTYPVRVAN